MTLIGEMCKEGAVPNFKKMSRNFFFLGGGVKSEFRPRFKPYNIDFKSQALPIETILLSFLVLNP